MKTYLVMVAHERGVDGGEERLLAVPRVAGLEAESRLGLALGVLRRQREELTAAVELGRNSIHLKTSRKSSQQSSPKSNLKRWRFFIIIMI